MSRRTIGTFSTIAVLICAALLGASASASAAIVVNGDFETGNLEGWATTSLNHNEKWRTYSSSEAGGGGLPAPPSGRFAAETLVGEASAGTTFLYQDVALPADSTNQLSLYLYYRSAEPIAVPTPDTLFVSEATEQTVPANQQVRVDVLKPNAPIESLSPNDVLATPYASRNGDPQELAPTLLSADLSAFAGQTVRLRIAAAAQEGALAVGVDDVSIVSNPIVPPPVVTPTPTPPTLPSNVIVTGKLTLNKQSGSGVLSVSVPDAGTLIASDARRKVAIASRRRKGKARPILVRTATVSSAGAGTVKVPIRPTAAALKVLRKKGSLPVRLTMTFAPTGGAAASQPYATKLVRRLRPPPAPR